MNASVCLAEPCLADAALLESALGAHLGGGAASYGWLWQTVGATCCWAISDVICDACIQPGAKTEASAAVKGAAVAEAVAAVQVRAQPRAVPGKEPRSSETASGARSRTTARVPPRAGDGSPRAPAPSKRDAGPPGEVAAAGAPQPLLRLTPEQNALLSGSLSLVAVGLALSCGYWGGGTGEAAAAGADAQEMARLFGAGFGGCVHFLAYLLTLCAYSSASSTVITPLMQLSAVWMLPFSISAAALGLAELIRPVHLLSVALICAGGFLPAADGSLSFLVSRKFWQQRAVRFVILAEFLVCCYNVILHQATFFNPESVDTAQGDRGSLATLRFFIVSRTGNGLVCAALFATVPRLREQAADLFKVNRRFLFAALLGECLSLMGVGLVTFSYSSFYEPSVVNAAEGGLQQLFNLLFALVSRYVLGLGREVEQINIKCVSFLLVAGGLALSTA